MFDYDQSVVKQKTSALCMGSIKAGFAVEWPKQELKFALKAKLNKNMRQFGVAHEI